MLPSAHRCFEATLKDMWQEIGNQVLRLHARSSDLTAGKLRAAEGVALSRSDTRAAREEYKLDQSLLWLGAKDFFDIESADDHGDQVATRFVTELEARWRSFRSVEKSEQRRRDFLVHMRQRMEKSTRRG